jgi:alpha/beta superfamily hydrolase
MLTSGDVLADLVRQIPGPAGPLEALFDVPAAAPRAAVVFAHPLPTEGGTMHTKVVFQSAKALARIGCVVLRFNFRGVGLSAGTWDNGRGELDDYRAAVAFMAAAYPNLELWAAGFSFGSYIATTVGADEDRVCALIAIAPPVDKYEFASVKVSPKPKFIIHGTRRAISSAGTPLCARGSRRRLAGSTARTIYSMARQPESATRSRISRISHARRSNRARHERQLKAPRARWTVRQTRWRR